MVNSTVLVSSVDPNFAGMASASSEKSVPFFGMTTATPSVFIPLQSGLSVAPCFTAFVTSCLQNIPLSSYTYISNNAANSVFSQSTSFIRHSMCIKASAASNYLMKSDAFICNNMKSQMLHSQIPSSTQPSYFAFNYQPRISNCVPVASQFLDCT